MALTGTRSEPTTDDGDRRRWPAEFLGKIVEITEIIARGNNSSKK